MRPVNENNAARYNRVIANLQEVCRKLDGSAIMPVEEEQNARDGVVFLMLPPGNFNLSKPLAGAALYKHHFFDAVFESDEVKVITTTKLSPRVRFIVRDVWQDGVKLPLDVMREAFGIEGGSLERV